MDQGGREKGDTWPKVLRYNHGKYGKRRPAMRHKHFGVWQPYTWEDYYLNVKYLALGLLSLGMRSGDKVLIIGDNSPEWYYGELAAQANHGVSVGLFSDLTPSEIKAAAENCEARFALVEGQEQIDKLLEIKDALPLLERIVFWSYKGLAHYDTPLLAGWREVLQLGRVHDRKDPGRFEQNVEAGRAEDVCAIIYTAGTTEAAPKGAVHSHRTLRAGAEALLRLDPWTEEDNVVPYLPPVWIDEQWSGIGCHLLSGAVLNFAEAPETQQRDCRETGPSIVMNRARLWESQAATVQARILDADAFKRWAYRLLMPLGGDTAESGLKKRAADPMRRLRCALAEPLLLRPIKRSLGLANARICYTTGAILSPDAHRFYLALNLPLKSLYGTTEGGVLTGTGNEDISCETVGPLLGDAELKISAAGELVHRHAGTFLGYYNDAAKTAEVLRDGWFHSGDGGVLRKDGHLVYQDRLEEILALPGGGTLSPQLVESRLRFSPYIRDAWVMGGAPKGSLAAVIVIDGDTVGHWAGQRKVAFTNFAELSQAPEVHELVKRDIDRANRSLPAGAGITRYVNLHQEFDPDEAEVTRTRNLRKSFLRERYRTLVEALSAGRSEIDLEARVRHRDGRVEVVRTALRIQPVEGAGE